jgi:hypothetical protein
MSNQADERGDVGDFEADEQVGLSKYTFADRVKKRLVDLGVGQTPQPTLAEDHKGIFMDLKPGQYFDGRLPTVIRRLTLDQLSALYSLYSNYYAYIMYQTNLVAVERSEAKRQKEFIWSHLRKQYKIKDPVTGKTRTDQVTSDLARIDFRYITADAKYEELNVLYNCLQAMCDIAEKDMSVISREVTINQVKLEHDASGRNMGNRSASAGNRAWVSPGGKSGNTKGTTAKPEPVKTPKRPSRTRARVPVKSKR